MSDCEIIWESIQTPLPKRSHFTQKLKVKEELNESVEIVGEVIRTPRPPRRDDKKLLHKTETPDLIPPKSEEKRFGQIGMFVAIGLLACCSLQANWVVRGWREGWGITSTAFHSYFLLINIFLAILSVIPSTSFLVGDSSKQEFVKAYSQTSLFIISSVLSLSSSFLIHASLKLFYYTQIEDLNRNIFLIYERRFSLIHSITDCLFSVLTVLLPQSLFLLFHFCFHRIRFEIFSMFVSIFMVFGCVGLSLGLIPLSIIKYFELDLVGVLPGNHFVQFVSIVYGLPSLHLILSFTLSLYKIFFKKIT